MLNQLDVVPDDMPEPDARSILGGNFAYAISLGAEYCSRCAREARAANNDEHHAAYRTAVRVARLIQWIDDHDRPERTLYNGDGTLTVSSVSVDEIGRTSIERSVISATMSAARDLLGY
ncbi:MULTISPECIES: hypothetical protein [unclassified Paraburkholderia]|uniref:hypothetical protein n=1 Tax=unclassified Paraburkholderia TaxID=2615204 RepID=UPI002AAF28A7|nr:MULTISPECIES: hypothetical protein [unclassified Paraburkholderia]